MLLLVCGLLLLLMLKMEIEAQICPYTPLEIGESPVSPSWGTLPCLPLCPELPWEYFSDLLTGVTAAGAEGILLYIQVGGIQ